ncbi:MAG TPA: phage tail protein [Gemmatimonadaceae bacterium]
MAFNDRFRRNPDPPEPGPGGIATRRGGVDPANVIRRNIYAVNPRPWIPGAGPPAATPTQRTFHDPREYTGTFSAAGLPIDIALGRCLQPVTKLIYEESWNNFTTLTWIVSLCEGPIQSIQPVVDDKPLRLVSGSFTNPNGTKFVDESGFIQVYCYDGSQTSLASSGLGSFDPLAAAEEVHTGLALAVVFITFDPEKMNTAPNMTWILEGYRLCKDPVDGVQRYSPYPAVHARELLVNKTWGIQMPDDTLHLDDHLTNLGGWGRARNDCAIAIFPPKPSNPVTLANGGAGSIPAGSYYYTFTSVTGDGIETLESPVSSVITFGTASRVTVTVPAGGAGTSSRNIYRNAVSGVQTPRYLVGTIANNTAGATLSDNTPNTVLLANGATAPVVAPRPERYVSGILISRQANGQDWLDTILAHFAGKVTMDNGRYQCRVDQKLDAGYTPMVLRDEMHDDGTNVLPANVDPLTVEVWRKDETELFNVVTINYLDSNNNFQPASITIKRDKVKALLERPRVATYELPGCPDKNQALRIGTLYLNRAWDDLLWRIRGDRSVLALQPGLDVAELRIGGLVFDGRALKLSTDGDAFMLEGEEYHEESYAELVQNEDTPIGTTIPDPSSTPPNPTNCNVQEVPAEDGSGAGAYFLVTFTPGLTPYYRSTRVVVNDGLNTYVAAEQENGPVPIRNLRRGFPHLITLYTLTDRGTRISTGVTLGPITPQLLGPIVPDVLNLAAPFDTHERRGTITCTLPPYVGIDHIEVFDNFGNPVVPPRIASVPASTVSTGAPIDLKAFIHGDGYANDQVFSIIVKVVNSFGDKSPGIPISWTIKQNGTAAYTVGFDPRDVTFDGSAVWVANHNGGNVQRIKRSTGTVDLTVNVGSKPYGILYESGRIWVANYGSDTVTYMNTDGSSVGTLSLAAGDGPLGLIAYTNSTGERRIVVSCHKTNRVKIIDPVGLSVTGTVINVGRKPCFMYVVDVNGEARRYVANYLDNTVSVIFGSAVIATIPVGQGPFGITYDGSRLWVCNYADSSLTLIDPVTNSVIATIPLGTRTGPTDASYVDGYVWVTEAQARQVTRVNTATLRPTAHDPMPSSPRSIMYDGTDLWMPLNLNASSSVVPVTVTNPAPGGGTSAPVNFTILGVDPSPLPT